MKHEHLSPELAADMDYVRQSCRRRHGLDLTATLDEFDFVDFTILGHDHDQEAVTAAVNEEVDFLGMRNMLDMSTLHICASRARLRRGAHGPDGDKLYVHRQGFPTTTVEIEEKSPGCRCGHLESAHDAGECWTDPNNHAHPAQPCSCSGYAPVP